MLNPFHFSLRLSSRISGGFLERRLNKRLNFLHFGRAVNLGRGI